MRIENESCRVRSAIIDLNRKKGFRMAGLILEDGRKRRHPDRLRELVRKTPGTVRVASAYVTDRVLLTGITGRRIRLLTSLMDMDIASGATNLGALGALIESGVECRFFGEGRRLHAKVYIFGNAKAVVTSANLTDNAFQRNIEAGVEVSRQEAEGLRTWFDKLWLKAEPLTLAQLAELREQTAELRRDYVALKRRAGEKLKLPKHSLPATELSDDLRDLFDSAERFFVCNTDRKHTELTKSGGFLLEEAMHNRGFAAAWESFKFPKHMEEVKNGDAIFMFAKGVGIIGVGRALADCKTFQPGGRGMIQPGEVEWRVPVRWFEWRDDQDAFPYKSPNFTFWNVTGPDYADLRDGVRQHFMGNA